MYVSVMKILIKTAASLSTNTLSFSVCDVLCVLQHLPGPDRALEECLADLMMIINNQQMENSYPYFVLIPKLRIVGHAAQLTFFYFILLLFPLHYLISWFQNPVALIRSELCSLHLPKCAGIYLPNNIPFPLETMHLPRPCSIYTKSMLM